MVVLIFSSRYSVFPSSEYKYGWYSTQSSTKNFKGTIYIFSHNIYVNLYNRIPLSCWRILNPPNCSQFAFLETLVSRALDHFLPFLRVFSECSSFWNNWIFSSTKLQGRICNFYQLTFNRILKLNSKLLRLTFTLGIYPIMIQAWNLSFV